MSKASNGQQMSLEDALKTLDKNGEPIKWEKAEDGSYSAKLEEKGTKVKDAEGKDKQLPGNTYLYSITPRIQIVDVGVVEQVEVLEEPEQAAEVKKQAEIEKSVAESHESKTAKQKKF